MQFLKSKAEEGEVLHMGRPLLFSLLLGATGEVKSLGSGLLSLLLHGF